jgi:hypothetical protein
MADVTDRDADDGRDPGPMEAAVRRDLDRWGPKVADTALAASALDLARRLDVGDVRPTAASLLHAQLRATVLELTELAPDEAEADDIDELQRKRNERRGA